MRQLFILCFLFITVACYAESEVKVIARDVGNDKALMIELIPETESTAPEWQKKSIKGRADIILEKLKKAQGIYQKRADEIQEQIDAIENNSEVAEYLANKQ